ncbi:MAG: undecaprenyldiphospho-muramoylpentapeptide beta-N-acetylglucosaminyltransferase [Methylococcaceae bacterium]
MGRRILILAGGTGGHVYPALAVAQELMNRGCIVTWLGTKKGLEARVVPDAEIAIDWLPVTGIRGKGWNTLLKVPFMLFLTCYKAWQVIRIRRPHAILGMGGFVAGPGGLMARLMGIPLIIHEQNRVPGTTNRLLHRLAKVVLEAFPQSFPANVNARWVGNPLREEMMNFDQSINNIEPGRSLHVLVVGGSQGAKLLNEIIPKVLGKVTDIHIRHQTGKKQVEEVKRSYANQPNQIEVISFIEKMGEAYRWADLVICRAGAMTVSELAACGVPSILVPLANAIDDHQTANAMYLGEAGAAVVISEQQLSVEKVAEKVLMLQQERTELLRMSEKAKLCAKLDATDQVVDICLQECSA